MPVSEGGIQAGIKRIPQDVLKQAEAEHELLVVKNRLIDQLEKDYPRSKYTFQGIVFKNQVFYTVVRSIDTKTELLVRVAERKNKAVCETLDREKTRTKVDKDGTEYFTFEGVDLVREPGGFRGPPRWGYVHGQ